MIYIATKSVHDLTWFAFQINRHTIYNNGPTVQRLAWFSFILFVLERAKNGGFVYHFFALCALSPCGFCVCSVPCGTWSNQSFALGWIESLVLRCSALLVFTFRDWFIRDPFTFVPKFWCCNISMPCAPYFMSHGVAFNWTSFVFPIRSWTGYCNISMLCVSAFLGLPTPCNLQWVSVALEPNPGYVLVHNPASRLVRLTSVTKPTLIRSNGLSVTRWRRPSPTHPSYGWLSHTACCFSQLRFGLFTHVWCDLGHCFPPTSGLHVHLFYATLNSRPCPPSWPYRLWIVWLVCVARLGSPIRIVDTSLSSCIFRWNLQMYRKCHCFATALRNGKLVPRCYICRILSVWTNPWLASFHGQRIPIASRISCV